jgi:hypothetical protein
MPKKSISYKIINNNDTISHTTVGILQDNILKYKEKDHTIVHFYYDKNILERENNNLKLRYIFKENEITKGIIHIKEYNKDLEVDITTKSIKQKNDSLEIDYIIENDEYHYQLEVIE